MRMINGSCGHARGERRHAIDPVCGMKVDPATAKHRFSYSGEDYFFCCAGCRTKFEADPEMYLADEMPGPPEAARAPAGRDLHLPDASGGAAGRPGKLSDLRHGARARDRHARRQAGSGTRRHDAALLDIAGADAAAGRARHGPASRRAALARSADSPISIQLGLATPVVAWAGWPFFVRGWNSRGLAQPQHVHADRARHRRRHGSTASSPSRRRNCFRRPSATRTARSRSTSRRPQSSPRWCCWARCWSCARVQRRPARSGRCWALRPSPRGG